MTISKLLVINLKNGDSESSSDFSSLDFYFAKAYIHKLSKSKYIVSNHGCIQLYNYLRTEDGAFEVIKLGRPLMEFAENHNATIVRAANLDFICLQTA